MPTEEDSLGELNQKILAIMPTFKFYSILVNSLNSVEFIHLWEKFSKIFDLLIFML